MLTGTIDSFHIPANSLFSVIPLYYMYKGKSKTILLQAWTGPEGSRRLRLPDFKTVGT